MYYEIYSEVQFYKARVNSVRTKGELYKLIDAMSDYADYLLGILPDALNTYKAYVLLKLNELENLIISAKEQL